MAYKKCQKLLGATPCILLFFCPRLSQFLNEFVVLWHVQQRLIVVQPQVMVGYAHLVKRDFLRVFEETIRSPYVMQPFDIQYAVVFAHIFREPESLVPPALRQEYVRYVRLEPKTELPTRLYLCYTSRHVVYYWLCYLI